MAFGALKGTLSLTGTDVGATNALTGSVAVSVGDLVFVAFAQQTNLTASGATDDLGHTYAAVNAGTDAGTSTGWAAWVRVTTAGTLTTVTVAASASTNNFAGLAAVIEGPFDSTPLDANPANNTDGTSPFTCPATGTLAQADEAILCAHCSTGTDSKTATSPNLKAGQASGTSIAAVIGYQAVSATTSVSPAFTGTNNTSTNITASFKKGATDTTIGGYGSYYRLSQGMSTPNA